MIHESRNVKRRTLVRRFFNADGKSGGRQKREWEPAGIDNGQTISLRGQGNAGKNGGAAGDLRVPLPRRPFPFPPPADFPKKYLYPEGKSGILMKVRILHSAAERLRISISMRLEDETV